MRALILAATILGGVVPLSGLRAQQSELIFDITVARHSLVSTDGNAAAHLSAATSSFKGFNASSCVVADFPCCVTLRKSGSTQTWSNPDENIVTCSPC